MGSCLFTLHCKWTLDALHRFAAGATRCASKRAEPHRMYFRKSTSDSAKGRSADITNSTKSALGTYSSVSRCGRSRQRDVRMC